MESEIIQSGQNNLNPQLSKDWQIKKLKDISIVFQDGDWVESKDQSTAGIRLIQTGNIGNGVFKDRIEKARYISEDTFKKLRCTEIFKGDCLVSRLPDPVGRACLLPNTGEKMITVVDCTIIRLNNRDIIPNWFLYFSLSNEYNSEIQKQVAGATRQRISRKNLGLIPIPLPPLSEQKRIVAILDEAFEAIEKAKENTEQNLKNATELFESYLQGVFENKGDDWEEKIIKEVCELKSGTTISANLERSKGDVLYIKVGDMTLPNNEIEINTSSRFVNSNEIKFNQIIPRGAIIFPKRGGAIATNKKRKIVKPTIVDLNTMAIIPGNKIDTNYFFHWFALIDLNDISNGTSIPQINNYSFDDVKISFPKSKREQQTIVNQLDTLRAETQKLEGIYTQKLADLEELKKSLLQKAFAGELVK
jgi:type I restriction enzyme S subunit